MLVSSTTQAIGKNFAPPRRRLSSGWCRSLFLAPSGATRRSSRPSPEAIASLGMWVATATMMNVDGSGAPVEAPAPHAMATLGQSTADLEFDKVIALSTAQQEEFRAMGAQMKSTTQQFSAPLSVRHAGGHRTARSRLAATLASCLPFSSARTPRSWSWKQFVGQVRVLAPLTHVQRMVARSGPLDESEDAKRFLAEKPSEAWASAVGRCMAVLESARSSATRCGAHD